MPYTPLHLGPNGLVGIVFRRWLDLPVFLLVNLLVDCEVLVVALLKCGPIFPRYGHTLLVGTAVGLLAGVVAYPLRNLFHRAMGYLRLPYETSFIKMVYSGVLGAWLHILIDGLYRADVVLWWPSMISNPLCRYDKPQVEALCVVCFIGALIVYGAVRIRRGTL